MVKKLIQVLPYFTLAMGFAIVTAILDGQVSRKMMLTLDYALKGDVNTIKAIAPVLLLNAAALVPLGIIVALTNNLYKKKANVLLKKYYVTKVFHKDIAEFQKENNAKYLYGR